MKEKVFNYSVFRCLFDSQKKFDCIKVVAKLCKQLFLYDLKEKKIDENVNTVGRNF